MLPLCRHILHSGLICQQAAVNGTYYCRHHQVVRATLAQMDPKPETYGIYTPLPLVFPEDRAAIQTNAMVVMQALNDRKIDVRTANAYRGLLRLCEANLSHGPLVESGKDVPGGNVVHAVILTPQGEEIAIPREVLEEGEAEPVHGKECPCKVCDEEYRGAPIERHHVKCKCGMCEELPSGQPRSAQETTQLSSRPEDASADSVEGPNESPLGENFPVLSVSSVVKNGVPHPSDHPSAPSIQAYDPERARREDEDRITNYQDKAREIFSQLGYPFEAPHTSSIRDKEKLSESPTAC